MPKRKHSCNLFVLLTLWIICVSVLFCRAVDEGAGSPAVLLEDDFAEFDEEEFIHEHVNEGRSNKINAADVHTEKAQLREEMGMMEEFPVAAPDDLEEDPNIEVSIRVAFPLWRSENHYLAGGRRICGVGAV